MSLADLAPAERHRRIAGDLTELARGVEDWDAPAPVEGWSARDVLDHLVTWLPGFLAGGGVAFASQREPARDPLATWTAHVTAVQAVLDDPERSAATCAHPQVGSLPTEVAIDRFYTTDVFLHTWDLARASDQDVSLEPDLCSQLLDGMSAMEDVLRASGQYGPAVEVPDDADVQTRLVGFIGRDPAWHPGRSR